VTKEGDLDRHMRTPVRKLPADVKRRRGNGSASAAAVLAGRARRAKVVDPPTGTVTFLFTDIEGSTRLWEQYPEAMRAALARHDALLASCIEQYAGIVVRSRGEGDSFFAVFHRAGDAVGAACALQRALAAEPWPIPSGLCVRTA